MNPFSLIPLTAFVINSFVWFFAFARTRGEDTGRAFLLLCGSLTIWPLIDFLQWAPAPAAWQPALMRLQPIAYLSVGFLFAVFMLRFMGRKPGAFFYVCLALLLVAIPFPLFTDLFVREWVPVAWGVKELSGPLYTPIVVLCIVVPVGYGAFLLWNLTPERFDALATRRLRLLVIGGVATMCTGFVTDVVIPDILGHPEFPNLASSATVLFTLCVYTAMARYFFLDPKIERVAGQIFEDAKDAILILDRKGNVNEANRVARELLELDGTAKDRDRVEQMFQQTEEQPGEGAVLLDMRSPIGERRLAASISQIESGPTTIGSLFILRDVTEQKEAQDEKERLLEQLQQSQKMEALGRLAGGVAHDFNNLLSAIMGYAGLIKGSDDVTEPMKADVKEIENAARRAGNLTRQLLAFSRKEIIKPEVLSVTEVVTEMEKMLKRIVGEDIALLTNLAEDLWSVSMDRGQVEQVLVNLVVNARDAMPTGGHLALTTANIGPLEARGYLGPEALPGSYVRVTVTDNGIGMCQNVIEHIFEPFYTTKSAGKGTGLGLSTVYGIVKQAGGEIRVRSIPGKGTTMNLFLPMHSQDGPRDKEVEERSPPQGASETVMVVEDDENVRRLTARILGENGYQVLEAESGSQAVNLARHHEGPIHLLLTDVVMPGMSGKELADTLVQERPDVTVLFMSGYTDDVIAPHGVLADGEHLVMKPFEPDELLTRVRDILTERLPS